MRCLVRWSSSENAISSSRALRTRLRDRRQVEVLRELLRDRAAADRELAARRGSIERLLDRVPVDAVVPVEAVVLRVDHGGAQVARDLAERAPLPLQLERRAGAAACSRRRSMNAVDVGFSSAEPCRVRDRAPQDERADADRDETISAATGARRAEPPPARTIGRARGHRPRVGSSAACDRDHNARGIVCAVRAVAIVNGNARRLRGRLRAQARARAARRRPVHRARSTTRARRSAPRSRAASI